MVKTKKPSAPRGGTTQKRSRCNGRLHRTVISKASAASGWMLTFLMVVVSITLLSPSALSAGLTGSNGELRLELKYKDKGGGEIAVTGATVSISLIAHADDNGHGLEYTLTDGLTIPASYGSLVLIEALTDADKNTGLACEFKIQLARGSAGTGIMTSVTDAGGEVIFTSLAPGMYLVFLTDDGGTDGDGRQYTMLPSLIPIPYEELDGNRYDEVTACPKIALTTPYPPPPTETTTPTPPPITQEPPPPTESPPAETPSTQTPPPKATDPPQKETTPPTVTDPPAEINPPAQPPAPNRPNLIPDGDGYIETGDNGEPLIRWTWDVINETWVPTPLKVLSDLPQTSILRWPVPALSLTGMSLVAIGVCTNRRNKKRDMH